MAALVTSVGFRVITKIPRPPAEVFHLFDGVESTHVSDAMNRFGGMDFNIRAASPNMRVVGPAVTVRARPGDVLMTFKAVEIASPGDVIVVETRGCISISTWGDLLSIVCKERRLGGAVTDGAVRDLTGIRQVGFPVFTRDYLSPLGSLHDAPGEVNVPISCGGVAVMPGDVILADAHGVVVVPREDAEAVARAAQNIVQAEQAWMAEIHAGRTIPEWVNGTLTTKGCLIR